MTVLNRVSSNGLVFAADFNLPFHCSFPTIVEDLTSSTSVHNTEQVAEGLDGQGQFEFNLKYYTDASFTGNVIFLLACDHFWFVAPLSKASFMNI